ncbi:hypothetical protein O71_04658 [Pontibacter sp. BAB1700]|nr:hypothetical protein O71_04658 [Pontibacter sp. BAB1700]
MLFVLRKPVLGLIPLCFPDPRVSVPMTGAIPDLSFKRKLPASYAANGLEALATFFPEQLYVL